MRCFHLISYLISLLPSDSSEGRNSGDEWHHNGDYKREGLFTVVSSLKRGDNGQAKLNHYSNINGVVWKEEDEVEPQKMGESKVVVHET